VAAIKCLPQLLSEAASKKGVGVGASPLDLSLKALGKPIAAQLADLRSSVVSTLCHTLLALAQVCLHRFMIIIRSSSTSRTRNSSRIGSSSSSSCSSRSSTSNSHSSRSGRSSGRSSSRV